MAFNSFFKLFNSFKKAELSVPALVLIGLMVSLLVGALVLIALLFPLDELLPLLFKALAFSLPLLFLLLAAIVLLFVALVVLFSFAIAFPLAELFSLAELMFVEFVVVLELLFAMALLSSLLIAELFEAIALSLSIFSFSNFFISSLMFFLSAVFVVLDNSFLLRAIKSFTSLLYVFKISFCLAILSLFELSIGVSFIFEVYLLVIPS